MEFVNFTDVVIDKSGGNKKLLQSDFADNGQYAIIDQSQKFIAGFTDNEEYLVKSTDLPVVIFGDHTKAIKYIDFPFVMGADGIKVLKPKENCDVKYLYHYLKFVKIPDAGYSRHFKFLKEIQIPLPPLSEQQRIADILDKADDLRQKRQQSIAKLDELLQATFIDMFGDPVTNPKNWEVEILEKVTLKIGSGSTPTGGDSAYKKEGISLIRSLNVHDNKFIYKNLAFIDEQQADKLKNVIVKENDVLLNITGASVARCCIVPNDILPARVNQHVSILRVNERLSAEFLGSLLTSQPMKNHLLNKSGAGATREALTKSQLMALKIIIPPDDLQLKWKKFSKKIETQRNLLSQQLTQQNQLFQSLQQQAFNGTL